MGNAKWIILAVVAYLLLRPKATLVPGRQYSRLLPIGLAPGYNPPPISMPNAPLPQPPPTADILRMGRSLKF